MSGYSEEALIAHGLVIQQVMFLPKPFSAAALGRKVRQALRARSAN